MKLTLIRHGESEANVTGHWQGQGDSPLSTRGREQVAALAERLKRERFDRVVASDLTRAHDTAQALGRELLVLNTWREINVGRWEGLTRLEVAEQFPEEILELKNGSTTLRIGGGESWEDLRGRVEEALETLQASHRGQKVLVVSHGGVISTLSAGLLGASYRPPRPLGRLGNTSVTTLELEPEGASGARLHRYNDQSHLHPCSQWATERREAGAAVLALVALGPELFGDDGTGRARGNARLIAIEQLSERYGGFDHIAWCGGGSAHAAAAVLSQRPSPTGDLAETTTTVEPVAHGPSWASLDELARTQAGRRVAMLMSAEDIQSHVAELLGLDASRVAAPPAGTVSHVVFDGPHRTLADYAVGGPFD